MNIASTRQAITTVKSLANEKSAELPVVESKENWYVGESVFQSTDELLNTEQDFNYKEAVYTWSETRKASRPPTFKERAVLSLKTSARDGFVGAITGTAAGTVVALLSESLGGGVVAAAAGVGAALGGVVGLYRGATTNPLHYTDSGSLVGNLSRTENHASFSVDPVVETRDRTYFNLTEDNVSELLKADDLQGTHERDYHSLR